MPDSSIALLEKNEKVKERHSRIMKKIAGDEARSTEELDKQLNSVRKEMVDMKAFKVIYKKHSFPDPQKDITSHSDKLTNGGKPTTLAPLDSNRLQQRQVSLSQQSDPFRLKKCMADSGVIVEKVNNSRKSKPRTKPKVKTLHPLTKTSSYKSGGNKEDDNASEASHHSFMPGNCTSFFSLRQFYEKEKDKLVNYWSPSEQRKRSINRIIHEVKLPRFSVIKRQVSNLTHLDQLGSEGTLRTNADLTVFPPISDSSS